MGSVTSRLKNYVEKNAELYAIDIYNKTKARNEPFDVCQSVTENADTLIHLACKHGMFKLLGLLLNEKNSDVNQLNKKNQNVLHKACQGIDDEIQFECVEFLLKWENHNTNEKIQINVQDIDGNTPLHYATMNNLKKCVEILIKKGADLFIENKDKLTPCDIAENNRHKEMTLMLGSEMVLNTDTESVLILDIEEPHYGLTIDEVKEEKDKLLAETSDMLECTVSKAEILLRYYSWCKEDILNAWMEDPVKCYENCGLKPPENAYGTLYRVKEKMKLLKTEVCLAFIRLKKSFKEDNKIEIQILKCEICMDEIPKNEEKVLIDCGHKFCRLCWQGYLTSKIEDGHVGDINCPSVNCSTIIPYDIIESLIPPEIINKYSHFDINEFVDTNPILKWCPYPDCNTAVCDPLFAETNYLKTYKIEKKEFSRAFECSRGHLFCWDCLKEAHEPVSCENLNKWYEKCHEMRPDEYKNLDKKEEQLANQLWFVAKSKKCPKPSCKAPIEKNEGCNHMTCYRCKHQFCWLCLQPWKGHNTSKCNDVLQALTEQEANQIKETEAIHQDVSEKNRFFHYFSRFDNHFHSYELEDQILQQMKANVELLKLYSINHEHKKQDAPTTSAAAAAASSEFQINNDDINSKELLFVEEAIKELLRARKILAYSHVYAYYMDTSTMNHKKLIFGLIQTEYEDATENLSQIIARPYLKTPKNKVIQITKFVKSKRIEFLDTISKGLVLPGTPKNSNYLSNENLDDILKKYEMKTKNLKMQLYCHYVNTM